MSGFRTPEVPREQLVLWERRLEDAIPSDHPVRHLDYLLRSGAFAETFAEMKREYVLNMGKPPYHPRVLAGLYFYGMLERIRSSRKLEKACYSRLDVIWLMEGQTPDHSTIADFISKHGKQLRKLFRDVLEVMQRAGLVTLDHVAIDGTKIEADAGKSSVRLRQGKPGKGGCHVVRHTETFRWDPAGNQSRLVELGQQPEASLAWWRSDPFCEA